MISINLLPEELRENIQFSKKNRKILNLLKVISMLCLFILAGYLIIGASLLSSDSFFKKAISESEDTIRSYQPSINEKENIENKGRIVSQIRTNYKFWTKFNYILAEYTPQGIYLSTVTNQNNKLAIEGYARTKNDVGVFRDALEKTPAFSNVNIESIKEISDPENQNLLVNDFAMTMTLQNAATSQGGGQ